MVKTSASDTAASVTLQYSFDGSDPGYPFALNVQITYTLDVHGFSFAVTATNLNKEGWPLPFYNGGQSCACSLTRSLDPSHPLAIIRCTANSYRPPYLNCRGRLRDAGWHPYFLCEDPSEVVVTLDHCTDWLYVKTATGPQYPAPRYSNMVPTGQAIPFSRFNGSESIGGNASVPTYFDVEAKAAAGCSGNYTTTMLDPVSGDVLRMSATGFPFLQVWTGAKSAFGVNAVVLEPLSAMSDGFNNHDSLHIINPGQVFTDVVHVSLA